MTTISKITKAISVAIVTASLVGNVRDVQAWSWKTPKLFSMKSNWPFRDKDEPQEGTPTRMIGTWTDTVLTQPGQKPQRGFGGRLMFYEHDEQQPIVVDGQLVVYAFDESGREPTDNCPTRRYVFPADQMPLHMSKSEFGASYSFWLPWDEAGGPRAEISLICRFEPKSGAVVTSEQTRHVLPGSIPPTVTSGHNQPPKLPEGIPSKPVIQTQQTLQISRNAERNAQLASYESPIAGQPQVTQAGRTSESVAEPVKRMTSTTIALPGSFQMPSSTPGIAPASSPQMLQQTAPQFMTSQQQPLPQPSNAVLQTTVATMPANSVGQPFPMASRLRGPQPLTSQNSPVVAPASSGSTTNTLGATAPVQQQQFNGQPLTFPTTRPLTMPQTGWTNSPAGQMPMSPQQLQQQMMQQQMMQQQMLQQQMSAQHTLQPTPAR